MIRVGVGGWTFAPWRGTFFPPGLPHKDELSYASRKLTAIEINGTFYRTQTPASFAKWREESPDGFVFAMKGHRFVTNRKNLREAEESVGRFLASGLAELGPKLGPINWQLAHTKRFDPDEVETFLSCLPVERDGVALRHAIEARHASFACRDFVDLARRHGVAIVFADHETYPAIPDPTAPFTYARLQRCREAEPDGYAPAELDGWRDAARTWAAGGVPAGLPTIGTGPGAKPKRATAERDAFVFFIAGDKVRAPAAATALIGRL